MRNEPVYVYAVTDGRPSARALAKVPALPDGGPPRVVSLDKTLSLIVADVSAATYNRDSLNAGVSDLEWVSRCGAAHHAVADALVESHAVVPLRPFTLFSSEEKALSAMRKSKRRVTRALARVKGRHEWVLRIGAPDPARLSPTVETTARSDPSDRGHQPRITPRGSGTRFLQRKAHARREKAERAARASAAAAALYETLSGIADEATTRSIEPGMNLILDAAFLVAKGRTAALRRQLKGAAAGLLRDGCSVSLTGPWPPYSFAALD